MSLQFSASQEALDLGIKIVTAQILGVQNVQNPAFEAYKEAQLEEIRKTWEGRKYKDDPILEGFRELHTKVGRSNRDYVASPEGLRWLFLERGRFPKINTVVDIYNLVSLKSGLALGAHDIRHVHGNIALRLTKGDENFVPLGSSEPVAVFPGEYAYVDDENTIICRMEVLQVEATKVTSETSDLFIIIQGNANTDGAYVQGFAQEVCELIAQYCGGQYSFL